MALPTKHDDNRTDPLKIHVGVLLIMAMVMVKLVVKMIPELLRDLKNQVSRGVTLYRKVLNGSDDVFL